MTDQQEMLGRDESLAEFRARRGTGAKFVTMRNVIELIEKAMLPAIADGIKGYAAPLLERIDALERRLVELEQKGVEYVGTWQRAAEYRRGQMTTHAGSVWAATRGVAAGEQPGSPDSGWVLAVKSGRDARDAR